MALSHAWNMLAGRLISRMGDIALSGPRIYLPVDPSCGERDTGLKGGDGTNIIGDLLEAVDGDGLAY